MDLTHGYFLFFDCGHAGWHDDLGAAFSNGRKKRLFTHLDNPWRSPVYKPAVSSLYSPGCYRLYGIAPTSGIRPFGFMAAYIDALGLSPLANWQSASEMNSLKFRKDPSGKDAR